MNTEKDFGEFQDKPNGSDRRRLFIGVLIVLFLLNGVLIFQWWSTRSELSETQEELFSTEELKDQLQKELGDLEVELHQYMEQAEELDELLSERNKELREKAGELQKMLDRQEITEAELSEAREELGVLRYYTDKYQKEIDSLERSNERLKAEKSELEEHLQEEKRQADRLKDENVSLSNRVSLAERLEVTELEASGIRYTMVGERARNTNRLDRMEKLRVCFSVDDNEVAKPGRRNIYVRLLTPEGSTVHIEEAGSGSFNYMGKEHLYTMSYGMNYQNKSYRECIDWPHIENYRTGEYKVQLYADEHLIGEQTFQIR